MIPIRSDGFDNYGESLLVKNLANAYVEELNVLIVGMKETPYLRILELTINLRGVRVGKNKSFLTYD